MKLKTKLIATLMSLCLVVALGVIGIFAVKTLNMSVGGNITFTADGISFTVGNGKFYQAETSTEYANITNQTGKLQGFAMNTNTKLSDVQGKIDSWSGLELALDSKGDAELKFTVTNNMATEAIYLNISINLGTNTNDNMNIVVTPSVPTINANQSQEVSILFDILDTNINAGLTGFEVAIEFVKVYSVTSGSAPATEIPQKYSKVKYTLSDGKVAASAVGECPSGVIEILAVVNIGGTNYQVTEVADNAFYYTDITMVVFPRSIKKLGKYCFAYSNNLTSIKLSRGIEEIGECAFYNCTALTSITIPSFVSQIGKSVFENCNSLQEVDFENTENWYSYTNSTFTSGETTIDVSNATTNATNLVGSNWKSLYLKRKA